MKRPSLDGRALGRGGALALLLGAAAAALAWGVVPAWRAEADRLTDEALRARQSAARLAARPAAPAWHERLPAPEQARERLAALLALGLRHGMQVQRTEQRALREPGSAVERLQLAMPLAAPYADLRAFIEAALAADDALSLDSVRLHRPTPQAGVVEADLVWSLHQRRATAGAAP